MAVRPVRNLRSAPLSSDELSAASASFPDAHTDPPFSDPPFSADDPLTNSSHSESSRAGKDGPFAELLTQASSKAGPDERSYQLSEIPGAPSYLISVAMRAAVDQKGLDVRALDVSRCTNIADVFLIVSATSERHVESLSDKIRAALGAEGEQPAGSSGYGSSQWVILDYGNLVVHIFYEPVRQHYHFDELWQKGIQLSPPPSLERDMRMLRTGMYR